VLWAAGQKRERRDERERLAALYAGVRDGYIAGRISTGAAKASGVYRPPEYTRPEDAERAGEPPAMGLARLIADHPGRVERGAD
jgi:hypothetical protein